MSFGWSAGDIAAAVQLLIQVGQALKEGGSSEKYQQAILFLESLATTLELVRQSASALQLADNEILSFSEVKTLVDKFCTNVKKRFEVKLGKDAAKDWTHQLRSIPNKIRYALINSKEIEELQDRVARPLQTIQTRLGLKNFEALTRLRYDISVLSPKFVSEVEGVISSSLDQYRAEVKRDHQSIQLFEVLQWLYPDVRTSIADIHDEFVRDHLPGSCRWFLESDNMFRLCRESNDCEDFLWVTGPPGTGKTRLASRAIQHLQETRKVAYFYCDTKDEDSCDILKILCIWVWQLLRQDTSKLEQIANHRATGAPPTVSGMEQCLQRLLAVEPGEKKKVLVLDALDECPVVVQSGLCRLMARQIPTAKVLLFSRPSAHLSLEFNVAVQDKRIASFNIRERDTKHDLDEFIHTNVKRRLRLPNEELHAAIVNTLILGARGMFQWAKLMIEELAKPGKVFVEDFLETLEDLPNGLDELYERILNSLFQSSHRDRSHRLLQWIVCSSRPLNLKELATVLALEPDRPRTRKTLLGDFKSSIRQLCGSLIEIKDTIAANGIVTLVHASAKDFLLDSRNRHRSFSSLIVQPEETHEMIFRCCITYLCDEKTPFPDFHKKQGRAWNIVPILAEKSADNSPSYWVSPGKPPTRNELEKEFSDHLRNFPLLEYAALQWFVHFARSNGTQKAIECLRKFCTSSPHTVKWLQIYLCLRGHQGRSRSSSALGDISYLRKLRNFLRGGIDEYGKWLDHLQGPPHGWFSRWELFLDHGRPYGFLHALHVAAFFDFEDFVKSSITSGADVNEPTFTGMTPLCLAARGDAPNCAELLLAAGAHPNLGGLTIYAPPLSIVFERTERWQWIGTTTSRPFSVVPLLLKAGVRLNHMAETNAWLGLPLIYKACRNPFSEHPYMLELIAVLLDHSGRDNINGGHCWDHDSALQYAVRNGFAKLVTLLLQHGADCNGYFCPSSLRCKAVSRILDPWGELQSNPDGHLCPGHKTTLLMACARSSPDVSTIKSLLSAGASVHARCHDGRTALHLLATAGNASVSIAELLLTHGADVCALADDGSLPILDALRERNVPLVQFLETKGGPSDNKKGLRKLSDSELEQDSGANHELVVLLGQPHSAETAPVEDTLDTTYWPRSERDQYEAFYIVHDSVFRKQLKMSVVLEILSLAEYWIKRSVSRAEKVMVRKSSATEKRIYLKSNKVQGRSRNPVQKARFVIRSHDQGWSSFPTDHGTYSNSWTWFDLEIQTLSGRFLDFNNFGDQKLVINVHARKEATKHTVTVGLHTLFGSPEWLDWIQPGYSLCLVPRAAFPGWENHVEFAQIDIYTTYLPSQTGLEELEADINEGGRLQSLALIPQ